MPAKAAKRPAFAEFAKILSGHVLAAVSLSVTRRVRAR